MVTYTRVCVRSAISVLVAVSVLLASSLAFASPIISFDFVSEPAGLQPPGACIEFNGTNKTVTFPNAGDSYDFVITQSDTPTMIGIKGNISGAFSVGSIATAGSLQTAPLTGLGTFSLTDPSSKVLSATAVWNDIFTYGAAGGVNSDPASLPNLTGWSYDAGGTFQPFLDILQAQAQTANITFQFSLSKKLSVLMAAGADTTTTYSGSFSMTPEPATMALLALGGLFLLRRRKP